MQLSSLLAQKIAATAIIRAPVRHLIIDEMLPTEFAETLSAEFGDYTGEHWHRYSNSIEEKRTCNQWNLFGKTTYQYFQAMCCQAVSAAIAEKFAIEVAADFGLHGGGQHIHARLGNLNPHLDYAIHPKLGLERRLNAIYYLTDDYRESDGGHFGLWDNDSAESPGELAQEYAPFFNRFILFDTSENSWHGLSRIYAPPHAAKRYRKSLATYYVAAVRACAFTHSRARFAPREEQKGRAEVMHEIALRADERTYRQAYRIAQK
ncbi:MAG: 2OG-Fe(II) oxygenase [Cellvibrionales bacterium]|nr:2OG-Fe(II) oxygenase [Cellvibrionales bacterium]